MKTKDESSPTENDIEYYLELNLNCLSAIGLECNLYNDDNNQRYRFSKKWLVYLTNLQGIICAILEIYSVMNALPDNTPFAMKVSSQMISNVQCVCKGFQMAYSIDTLQKILQELTNNWRLYRPNKCHRKSILKEAFKILLFCKSYLIVMLSCIICCDTRGLINILFQYLHRQTMNHTYDYSQRILDITYPFDINTASTFWLLFFWEGYLFFMSAVYWGTCDTLFAQITTHTCLQFEILKYDLETLINYENNINRLKKNLIIFVKRHQELLRCHSINLLAFIRGCLILAGFTALPTTIICKLIDDAFSPVIFSAMLLSALNICVTVLEVRETLMKGAYVETVIYFFMFITMMLQILFYCVLAERLTEQTSTVASTIYNCKWTNTNYKFRYYVQMVIMRSQRPFYCTAYGFFPIGNKQLSSIISTSFSYYMMLETMS